jgi:hypothetical protein
MKLGEADMKTSSKKIEANQRNAQRSTGPRTPEGRAASSRNAIRTGLTATTITVMPGESQDDLDQLSGAIRNEWNPSGDHENFLVNQMISARWRLERLARWEHDALDKVIEGPECFFNKQQVREFEAKSPDRLIVEALSRKNTIIFDRIERYTRAAERAYSKAVKELQQHRAAQAGIAQRNEAAAKQNKAKEAEEWLRAGLAEIERNGITDPMAGLWDVEPNEPNFESVDPLPDSALSA